MEELCVSEIHPHPDPLPDPHDSPPPPLRAFSSFSFLYSGEDRICGHYPAAWHHTWGLDAGMCDYGGGRLRSLSWKATTIGRTTETDAGNPHSYLPPSSTLRHGGRGMWTYAGWHRFPLPRWLPSCSVSPRKSPLITPLLLRPTVLHSYSSFWGVVPPEWILQKKCQGHVDTIDGDLWDQGTGHCSELFSKGSFP